MKREELIQLAQAAAKAFTKPSTTFSISEENLSGEAIIKAYERQLNELGKDSASFRENKNLIFTLMEIALSEYIPVDTLSAYGMFAEVVRVPQGDEPVFKVRISEFSKRRAKQFVTKVGLAGRYETFKLDGYTLRVPTTAFGGAARLEWEEFLNNTMTMADYFNLVREGIDEAVFKEIAKALQSLVSNLKAANKSTQVTFDEKEMDRLLSIADAYGKATIYCTYEFAATMIPADARMSDNMKDELWNNGYATTYKTHRVVVLPQSFEDETNTKKVLDPSFAYILPVGAEKPVKIGFEGNAQVKEFENRDWSMEIQTYQKLGVAIYTAHPGMCVYQNTSLKQAV